MLFESLAGLPQGVSSATVATRHADWNHDGPPPLDAAWSDDASSVVTFSAHLGFRGINHEEMNFPDSFSNKIIIFLGCWSLSKETTTVSSAATFFKVSWFAQGSPESFGKSTVCVRATAISSSCVIVNFMFRPCSRHSIDTATDNICMRREKSPNHSFGNNGERARESDLLNLRPFRAGIRYCSGSFSACSREAPWPRPSAHRSTRV